MGLTSVLDIQVNDSGFAAYKKAFDEYRAAVVRLPADWDKADKKIKGTKKSFDDLVATMVARGVEDKQHVAAQKEADRLTRTQADHWRSIAKNSKDFVGNIVKATESFLRWVGPLSLASGLLGGAAGLYGLERLGASVSAQRRSAGGLGVGYGDLGAFGLNYGRFIDTRGLLGGVSGALYNATSPGYTGLLAAGLSPKFLGSHNAAEVSAALVDKLPALFHGTPRNLVGAKAQALGLDSVISTEDIVRLLNASPNERAEQSRRYRQDRGTLDLDPTSQRKWQDFTTQLERAGASIENTFIRGLTPLTDPLAKLSGAFENLVRTLLGSEGAEKAIKALTAGIENFAKYVGTDDFQRDVRDFVSGVAGMAKAINNFLGLFKTEDTPAAGAAPKKEYNWFDKFLNPFGGHEAARQGAEEIAGFFKRNLWNKTSATGTPSQYEDYVRKAAVARGINPDTAWNVAKMESGGKPLPNHWDVDGPSAGLFQLHYNARHNALGDQYTARTGRDINDQEHWREQVDFALDKASRGGWRDWSTMRGHDPYEGIGTRPVVTIENRTGGDPVISTSAAVGH